MGGKPLKGGRVPIVLGIRRADDSEVTIIGSDDQSRPAGLGYRVPIPVAFIKYRHFIIRRIPFRPFIPDPPRITVKPALRFPEVEPLSAYRDRRGPRVSDLPRIGLHAYSDRRDPSDRAAYCPRIFPLPDRRGQRSPPKSLSSTSQNTLLISRVRSAELTVGSIGSRSRYQSRSDIPERLAAVVTKPIPRYPRVPVRPITRVSDHRIGSPDSSAPC